MNYDFIHNLIAPYCSNKLFLGLSGGADSVALLLVIREIMPNSELIAIHFEHGLRGEESLADAAYCQDLCNKLKIECRVIPLKLPDTGNIENEARNARLKAWSKITQNETNFALILGHHGDDKIENMFLRLCRGANTSGLTSLRYISNFDGMTIIRPLLGVSRAEIECYLQNKGITDWRIDATNLESEYRRNFLRNEILPKIYQKMPFSKKGIERAMEALEDDADYIEEIAETRYKKIARDKITSLDYWNNLHTAVLVRILRLYLTEQLGEEWIPTHAFVIRFRDWLTQPTSSEESLMPLTTDLFWAKRNDELEIVKKRTEQELLHWQWRNNATCNSDRYIFKVELKPKPDIINIGLDEAIFDADLLPEILTVETWQEGDRMIPFAQNSPENLKKLRIDRKLGTREVPPLLKAQEVIIWAPQIRHSNFATINSNTKNIAKFTIIDK